MAHQLKIDDSLWVQLSQIAQRTNMNPEAIAQEAMSIGVRCLELLDKPSPKLDWEAVEILFSQHHAKGKKKQMIITDAPKDVLAQREREKNTKEFQAQKKAAWYLFQQLGNMYIPGEVKREDSFFRVEVCYDFGTPHGKKVVGTLYVDPEKFEIVQEKSDAVEKIRSKRIEVNLKNPSPTN